MQFSFSYEVSFSLSSWNFENPIRQKVSGSNRAEHNTKNQAIVNVILYYLGGNNLIFLFLLCEHVLCKVVL